MEAEEATTTTEVAETVCELCSDGDTDEKASTYCTNCQQRFCSSCARKHSSHKAFKQHKLIDIAEMPKLLDSSIEELCESCLNMEESNPARRYCVVCNEKFCEECSRLHRKMKLTKPHLCITIEEFNEMQQSLKVPCMQCNGNGANTEASQYCPVCEEDLCWVCTQNHKISKSTKQHELVDIHSKQTELKKIPDLHSCYPCKVNDRDVNAAHHCAVCEKYYCSTYGELHGRQKATLSHNLVKVAEMGKPKNERDYKGDDMGSDEQKSEYDEMGSELEKPEQSSRFQQVNTVNRFEADISNVLRNCSIQKDMDMIPGTPTPNDVQSDSIELFWKPPECLSPNAPEYQIRYKEGPNSKWRIYSEEYPDQVGVRIKGLKSGCRYRFKVRAVYGDYESRDSPESTEITTNATLASTLLPFTTMVKKGENGTPSLHRLNSIEFKTARNDDAKVRKLEVGKPPHTGAFEKTILLVGETGSGKSTMVDGFINYIAGVNYEDPYRFTVVDREGDGKGKSQAFSQTKRVTRYTIHSCPGSRIQYTLNIIDTPGFGDTGGFERDKAIFEQLRQLFSSSGENGVVFIDAVCFLMKAPDARLTPTLEYIFSSVLSIFGKDIEDNIFALITFADGRRPLVLSAIEEAKLPVKSCKYVFNNIGLFEKNVDDSMTLAPIFWKLGHESFQKFFNGLENTKTKSLQQTKEVLENRRKIEVTLSNLLPLIDAGLRKQEAVRKEILIIKEHESDIAANKNFEYTVEETRLEKLELPKGKFATNCLNCKLTCHKDCWNKKDLFNYFCSAMNLHGNCTVCDGKCPSSQHTNEPSIYRFVTIAVTKTYKDQLVKYQTAKEKKLTHQQYLEEMNKDLSEIETIVFSMMEEVRHCKKALSEIALQPSVISMEEHIDLMIQTAEMEMKEGFQERIAALKRHRERIGIENVAEDFTAKNAELMGKQRKKGFSTHFLLKVCQKPLRMLNSAVFYN